MTAQAEVIFCQQKGCTRKATYFWAGSNYERPAFFCGYCKRAYMHTYRWMK